MQEQVERILSEKLATSQSHVEGAHRAASPAEDLTSTWISPLQNLSQEVQALQRSLESMQASMLHDRQPSRADLEGIMSQVEKAVQGSWSERNVAELESKLGMSPAKSCFLLSFSLVASCRDKAASPPQAKEPVGRRCSEEGYTSGKRYWEVDVGKRRNWDLGIAREPVTRKGTLTLSPENGFWVIGLADGQDYWARTEPWTRLAVSGKPRKIGIFLDTAAQQLSFYNVPKETAVYTFSLGGASSQGGKFFPFFSTGSTAGKPDTEPLKILQGFEDDE
nr:PREDICTED: pyrin-like [Struthio camelus australis]